MLNLIAFVTVLQVLLLGLTAVPAFAQTASTNSECSKISQTLSLGKKNQSKQDVIKLQHFLKSYIPKTDNRYDKDGAYGSSTKKQVQFFQSENGIPATGVVGTKTLAKINSMICWFNVTKSEPQTLTNGIYYYANNGFSRNDLVFDMGPDGKAAHVYISAADNGDIASKVKSDIFSPNSSIEALPNSPGKLCNIVMNSVEATFKNLKTVGNVDNQGRKIWIGDYISGKGNPAHTFSDECYDTKTKSIISSGVRSTPAN